MAAIIYRTSVLIWCVLLVGPSAARAQEIDPEEYAVYAAVIKHYFAEGKLLVISDHAAGGAPTTPDNPYYMKAWQHHYDYVKREHEKPRWPGVPPELLGDVQAKSPQPLSRRLTLDVDYVLISQQERAALFPNQTFDQRAWQAFFAKYPNSLGLISFSRVGFNAQRTHAFVSVGHARGFWSREGFSLLLTKIDGVWTVQHKLTTSIS